MYYDRQQDSMRGSKPVNKVTHQYELKQRQQIQNVLQDFDQTNKFNKEQLKNFNSPKNVEDSAR